jgi:6-phospho-beta-glucosidase
MKKKGCSEFMAEKGRKLVIFGCGSAYTPELFDEVIKRNQKLNFDRISLVDIPEGMECARIILAFGKRMFQKAGISCDLSLTTDRRQALKGADFVISQIRVGRMPARIKDETIGLQTGILGQETTGAGGFMNAMRTIPLAVSIAKDMEAICPEAWLINFTNPSGLVAEALSKYSTVKSFGLCNVPINMQSDAAKALNADVGHLRCMFAGLNHLSYVTHAELDGRDVMPLLVERISENETLMKNIPKVPGIGRLIRSIGIIPSPYLQYYYFEDQMLKKQQEEFERNGQTRGSVVEEINRKLFVRYADVRLDEKPAELSQRGGSLYSFAAMNAVEALCSDALSEMVLNVPNRGSISDLEDGDVVETNCIVSRNRIAPIPSGRLPQSVKGLVQTVKQYERCTAQAAMEFSRKKALEALLNHPLIHGYANACAILDKMEENFQEYISLH